MNPSTTQAPTLTSTAMKALISRIEKDLNDNDLSPDNLPSFLGILWLEAPKRSYAADAAAMCVAEANGPYSYLINELNQRLLHFQDSGINPVVQFKIILIICELIKVLPVRQTSVDINLQLNSILKCPIPAMDKEHHLQSAISDVLAISVIAGSNPVPGIMLASQEKQLDIFEILKKLSVVVRSPSSFRVAFGALLSNLPMVQPDKYIKFYEALYEFTSTFITSCPAVHKELLSTGLNQVETIITALLKWKSPPPPEALPLFASLMPFCTNLLKTMPSTKKGHPFQAILKEMENYKKKKERIYCCLAFLELIELQGESIDNQDFNPFFEFISKHKSSIESVLFDSRKEEMPIEIITKFLPRYTAIEYVMTGGNKNAPAISYLLSHQKEPIINKATIDFLNLLYSGYPAKADLDKVDGSIFEGLSGTLLNQIQNLESGQLKPEDQKSTLKACQEICEFIGYMSPEFSLATLKNLQDLPAKVHQSPQFKKWVSSNKKISDLTNIIKALITMVSFCNHNELIPFVTLLRAMWTCDKFWQHKLSKHNKDVVQLVSDLASTFYDEIKKMIESGNCNIEVFPVLFYRFLKWSYFGLTATSSDGVTFPEKTINQFSTCILFLRGVTLNRPLFDKAEEVLSKICENYNTQLKYRYPMTDISAPDPVIGEAALTIFTQWLSAIKKSYVPTVVTISEASLPSTVSQERIAAMTAFLCQFIHHIERRGIPGTEVKSLHEHFFLTCFKYVQAETIYDIYFGRAFAHLVPSSLKLWVKAFKISIPPIIQSGNIGSAATWKTLIGMFTAICKVENVDSLNQTVLQRYISYILGIITFDLFPDDRVEIIELLSQFAIAYSTGSFNKIYQTQLAIIQTLTDSASEHCELNSSKYSLPLIIAISSALTALFKDFNLNQPESITHSSDHQFSDQAQRLIYVVLDLFNRFLLTSNDPKLINSIHDTLINIISANYATALPLLLAATKPALNPQQPNPLFLSVLMEVLTQANNCHFQITTKVESQPPLIVPETPAFNAPPLNGQLLDNSRPPIPHPQTHFSVLEEDSSSHQKKESHKHKNPSSPKPEKTSDSEELSTDTSENSSSRSSTKSKNKYSRKYDDPSRPTIASSFIYARTHLKDDKSKFNYQISNSLPDTLTIQPDPSDFTEVLSKDNYEAYLTPPSTTDSKTADEFLKAAVVYAIVHRFGDDLFDTITKRWSEARTAFSLDEKYTKFYTAWFRAMSATWVLPEAKKIIPREEKIDNLVHSLIPPPEFAYYISRFSQLTADREATHSLFTEAFLRHLFVHPWFYRIEKRPYKSDSLNAFLKLLSANKDLSDTVDAMISAEPIYPELNVNSYTADVSTLSHFLSPRPYAIDEHTPFDYPDWVIKEFKPGRNAKPSEILLCHEANWVSRAGLTKTGQEVFYISFPDIPSNLSLPSAQVYFYSHFSLDSSKHYVFVIDFSYTYSNTIKYFKEFVAKFPEPLFKLIDKVLLLHPTIIDCQSIDAMGAISEQWTSKTTSIDDINDFFYNDDNVYFPPSAFSPIFLSRGQLPLSIYGNQAMAYATDTDIFIEAPGKIFGINANLGTFVSLLKVTEISSPLASTAQSTNDIRQDSQSKSTDRKPEDETVQIMYQPSYNHPKILIKTKYPTAFRRLLQQGRSAFKVVRGFNHAEVAKLTTGLSGVCINELALALYTLASRQLDIASVSVGLFESALFHLRGESRSLRSISMAIGSMSASVFVNLRNFFREVASLGMLKPVALALSHYLTPLDPQAALHLLSFLADFSNACTDEGDIAVLSTVFRTFFVELGHKMLVKQIEEPLEHFLYAKMESKVAIQALLLVVLCTKLEPVIVIRTFGTFMNRNRSMMVELLVTHLMDGFIRRRCFSPALELTNLFIALPTLSYSCCEFLEADMARLIFCCVVGSIHTSANIVTAIRNFLDSLLQALGTSNHDATVSGQNLVRLMGKADVDPIDLIKAGDLFMASFGEEAEQSYHHMFAEMHPDDSPAIWYIKVAAGIQFGHIDPSLLDMLILQIPELLNIESEKLREDKLALIFYSIANIIPGIDPEEMAPLFIFWAPLAAISSANPNLRRNSLSLLNALIPWLLKNARVQRISGLETTQYVTDKLAAGVSKFEEALGAPFSTAFVHNFVNSIIPGFRDSISKPEALELCMTMVEQLADTPQVAAQFLVPIIAYVKPEEYDFGRIVSLVGKGCNNINEVLFRDTDKKNSKENAWVSGALAHMIGGAGVDFESVMGTLMYAAGVVPGACVPWKECVVQSCWKLIDSETNQQMLERIASLCASYLTISDGKAEITKEEAAATPFNAIEPTAVSKVLAAILEGVDAAMKLD